MQTSIYMFFFQNLILEIRQLFLYSINYRLWNKGNLFSEVLKHYIILDTNFLYKIPSDDQDFQKIAKSGILRSNLASALRIYELLILQKFICCFPEKYSTRLRSLNQKEKLVSRGLDIQDNLVWISCFSCLT